MSETVTIPGRLAAGDVHAQVEALLASNDAIIVGPWTGEVGFELLYWIPFLNWVAAQGVDPRRFIVVSRGGAAAWYAHLTSRYVDILDIVSAEEFRQRTEGPKKQLDPERAFDRDLVRHVANREGVREGAATTLHPAVMYGCLADQWRRRASSHLIESFTIHRPLTRPGPVSADDVPGLPDAYVAMKFYFSKALPDRSVTRNFVKRLVERVAAGLPVVLLQSGTAVDDHLDVRPGFRGNVIVVDTHKEPSRNLDLQTRLVAGSRAFVGTYGGFSYLAPFVGVRSLSFFSRRSGFEAHHLDLANRVFDDLLPGAFVALDIRAGELVEPAVSHWAAPQVSARA